jgi:hypothetical protein
MAPHCTIEGRVVSPAEFDAFLATLVEIPHTWYCAESTNGGRTGYDAQDAQGVRWTYCAISEGATNTSSLERTGAPRLRPG